MRFLEHPPPPEPQRRVHSGQPVSSSLDPPCRPKEEKDTESSILCNPTHLKASPAPVVSTTCLQFTHRTARNEGPCEWRTLKKNFKKIRALQFVIMYGGRKGECDDDRVHQANYHSWKSALLRNQQQKTTDRLKTRRPNGWAWYGNSTAERGTNEWTLLWVRY